MASSNSDGASNFLPALADLRPPTELLTEDVSVAGSGRPGGATGSEQGEEGRVEELQQGEPLLLRVGPAAHADLPAGSLEGRERDSLRM
eukprot:678046-Hanusia_phi.AAC.1